MQMGLYIVFWMLAAECWIVKGMGVIIVIDTFDLSMTFNTIVYYNIIMFLCLCAKKISSNFSYAHVCSFLHASLFVQVVFSNPYTTVLSLFPPILIALSTKCLTHILTFVNVECISKAVYFFIFLFLHFHK